MIYDTEIVDIYIMHLSELMLQRQGTRLESGNPEGYAIDMQFFYIPKSKRT